MSKQACVPGAISIPALALMLLLTPASMFGSVIDIDLARFTTAKREQAREIARGLTNPVPSMVWSFFDAVQVDDWETSTNLVAQMNRASGRFEGTKGGTHGALQSTIWSPITEVVGAHGEFHTWDNKWLHRFGREIIDSIPRGSIYFGGTDPGRFVISALSESHREGMPFFIITQNQLADGTYLEYLRAMYGPKLKLPTEEESQRAFSEYVQDVQARLQTGKLKPGEDVRVVDQRIQVSGQVAVMQINALLAKTIFDKNQGRQFFIEESWPLDWMMPHLVPHGVICEVNSKSLSTLPDRMVAENQAFWSKLVAEVVGDWLSEASSVRQLCEFTDKVYHRKDLGGFKGDQAFVRNESAQKCFSKLRSAIAGLYAWRADQAQGDDERDRMRHAADLAFRQAIALCPRSPEAVFGYCNLLVQLKRTDDALLIVQSVLRSDPDSTPFRDLFRRLRETQ